MVTLVEKTLCVLHGRYSIEENHFICCPAHFHHPEIRGSLRIIGKIDSSQYLWVMMCLIGVEPAKLKKDVLFFLIMPSF